MADRKDRKKSGIFRCAMVLAGICFVMMAAPWKISASVRDGDGSFAAGAESSDEDRKEGTGNEDAGSRDTGRTYDGPEEDIRPQEAAGKVLAMAAVIVVAGGILNYFVNRNRKKDYLGKKNNKE